MGKLRPIRLFTGYFLEVQKKNWEDGYFLEVQKNNWEEQNFRGHSDHRQQNTRTKYKQKERYKNALDVAKSAVTSMLWPPH